MDRENRLRRRLKDAERIKKYLVRHNAPKTKITEIGCLVNFLDEELNRERIINTLTDVYLGNK